MPENSENAAPGQVWDAPWPADALERVAACPVCDGAARKLLHENLVDAVFRAAPGRWSLYRCNGCRSAYLDPRPDEASIGSAYAIYYTHAAPGTRDERGVVRRLKLAVDNGYLNWRYGTRRRPASRAGIWLTHLLPLRRQKRDAQFRWLPKPVAGQRLLDIGCGNGDFVALAQEAGWAAAGIDADPMAVAAAKQRGLDVREGDIGLFADQATCFDAITLSHLLEHLHDPAAMLRSIHRLLKPGGVVFVDTPNIESRGARRWGSSWRGLEVPRHLVIFSRAALLETLVASGFEHIQTRRRTAVRKSMYLASLRMQSGQSPYGRQPARLPLFMRLCLLWPLRRVEDDEFLTVLARKTAR